MARKARVISESGLYHIYFKGNCNIFRNDDDFDFFQSLLAQHSDKLEVYAFGFSKKDGHLFVKTHYISEVMKALLTDFAMRFNKKYNREGAVFCSRYKSEPVDVSYAAGLTRYIIKGKKRFGYSDFIKSLFGSQKQLDEFMKMEEPDTYGADCGVNSAEIKLKIANATDGADFLSLSNVKRAAAVKFLSGCGISKTAMAKYLGVSRSTIINTLEKDKMAAEKKRREEIIIL